MELKQLDVHRGRNLDLNLTPQAEINSKWISNLTGKCKIMKLVEKNV